MIQMTLLGGNYFSKRELLNKQCLVFVFIKVYLVYTRTHKGLHKRSTQNQTAYTLHFDFIHRQKLNFCF